MLKDTSQGEDAMTRRGARVALVAVLMGWGRPAIAAGDVPAREAAVRNIPGTARANVLIAVEGEVPVAAPTHSAERASMAQPPRSRISVAFVATPINEVIAVFAEHSGRTFVFGPSGHRGHHRGDRQSALGYRPREDPAGERVLGGRGFHGDHHDR